MGVGGRRRIAPVRSARPGHGAPVAESRRDARRSGAAVLVALVLSACASTQPVTPLPDSPSDADQPTVVSTASADARRAAGIADCPASDPRRAPVADGLPDITVDCLGGGQQVRLAGLTGPLVINVWAQWCAPCRAEAPFLVAAKKQRPDIAFLGVDFHDPDPASAIAFAHQAGWTWPQVTDPQRTLAGPLRVLGPPVTILVRADGTIAYRHVGQLTSADQLVDLMDRYLVG